jgi:hypothetical protein
VANKFYIVLVANQAGATWLDREVAARADASAVCEKIKTAFNTGRTPVVDYPDDNRPVEGENAYWGLEPVSRGFSVEVVISASRDERTALSAEEIAALVDELPPDGDRAWGNGEGI